MEQECNKSLFALHYQIYAASDINKLTLNIDFEVIFKTRARKDTFRMQYENFHV